MRFEPGVEVMWRDRKRWLGLPWTFTRYYLAKKEGEWVKLFRHKGLLSARIDEINVYRCFDLTLQQSLADKIFRTGTIEVESNDAAAPVFHLRHTKFVMCFQILLKLKEANAVLALQNFKHHKIKINFERKFYKSIGNSLCFFSLL